MNIKQKKEWAYMLFADGSLTQKDIAAKVGVSERTMSQWVAQGQWHEMRTTNSHSKQRALAHAQAQLANINDIINQRPNNYPDTKEADVIMKLTAAISRLEEETTLSDVNVIGKELTSFVQSQNPAEARIVATWYDAFIKHKIKLSR